MSKQRHPRHVIAFAILFLVLLLTIATGPFGFIALVIVGVPVAMLVGFESMTHGSSKLH